MSVVLHQRIQYPSGHGFFHSASISFRAAESSFDYIYDCGGKNKKLINREVSKFEAYYNNSLEIGMLVISHFHRDHTNGIEYLLRGGRRCDKLVIPYLKPLDRFYYVALDSSLLTKPPSKVIDPINYYSGKCNQLFMVKSSGEPVRKNPEGKGPLKISNDKFNITSINSKGKITLNKKNVYDIEDSNPITLNQGTQPFWNFEFYVQDSEIYMSEFKNKLKEKFPSELANLNLDESDDYDAVTEVLRELVVSPLKRRALKKCYEETIGTKNFNITSLCMLSYPAFSNYDGFTEFDQYHDEYFWLYGSKLRERIGWLGLGDAHIRTKEESKSVVDHFQNLNDVVSSMSIPHHGSSDNYSSWFLDAVQPRSSFVTCDSRMRKHPSKDVLRDLKSRRLALNLVTEKEESFYREDIVIFPKI